LIEDAEPVDDDEAKGAVASSVEVVGFEVAGFEVAGFEVAGFEVAGFEVAGVDVVDADAIDVDGVAAAVALAGLVFDPVPVLALLAACCKS
jgi:hypothetical protein